MQNNKPRILYIGFNRSYTSPTGEITLRVLASISDLDYFGPGFSTQEITKKGICDWIAEHGEYDFIVADSYVFEADNILKRKRPFIGDFIRFDTRDFVEYARSFQEFFLNYKGRKIFLANWDTYAISEQMIDRIVRSQAFVLDPGSSIHRSLEEIFEESQMKAHGNNNWYNFVSEFKSKIIAIPHTISSLEFDFSPVENRKYEFTVIGSPYPERKNAMKLQTKELQLSDFIGRIKSKVRFRFIKTLSEEHLINKRLTYLKLISSSKYCYCSGGPWLYPVRKYFEIPARGAAAIGWQSTGFTNLGFKDKVNFLIAKSNSELVDIIRSTGEDELNSIANNGRKLVWNKHSDWARAEQLKTSFDLILSNDFKGSYWHNGSYLHY